MCVIISNQSITCHLCYPIGDTFNFLQATKSYRHVFTIVSGECSATGIGQIGQGTLMTHQKLLLADD
jgi:hypothetical protein